MARVTGPRMGVTEQTDALAIVVSEETGSISLVHGAGTSRETRRGRLRAALVALLRPSANAGRAAAGISALGAPFARGKRPRVLRRRRSRGIETAAAADGSVAVSADRIDGRRGGPSQRDPRPATRRGPVRGPRDRTCRGWAGVKRALDFILRNWPLKLAALGLATVLYAGVTLSGNERTWPGEVPIEVLDPPSGAAVLDLPGSVTSIRYRAPIEAATQLTNGSFLASIDLGNVTPTAGGPPVPVTVRSHGHRSAGPDRRLHAPVGECAGRPGRVAADAGHGRPGHGPRAAWRSACPRSAHRPWRSAAPAPGWPRPVGHRAGRGRRERPQRGPGGGPGGDRRDGCSRARRGARSRSAST